MSLWWVMEGQKQQQQQHSKSRVVKVNSEESWNMFITQAKNQGCPVFVHFGASWCVPSLAMNAFFEELAMTYQDILFILVDVDEAKKRLLLNHLMRWVEMAGGGFQDGGEGNANICSDER
ncbi:thioredoxin-like protein CXXS1 isoform X2 [Zingiber officinale]|uniref:thioredoxin-like protein CXXS1 isoform X2 n=1 Tax=Zingiber officinale TaxID=94328 RepID=UPI001C4DC74E|nr:thioredoxin-like protein CXXS1 isoform X2 [Zingiber officinale]